MLLGCWSFFTQRFLNVFDSSGPRWGTLRLNLTQPGKFHQTRTLYCTRRIDRLRAFSNTSDFSRFLFRSNHGPLVLVQSIFLGRSILQWCSLLDHPFKASANFHDFWLLHPPAVFLLLQGVWTHFDILWRPRRPTKNNFYVIKYEGYIPEVWTF